jgi:DNA-binding NtrC family response regulator
MLFVPLGADSKFSGILGTIRLLPFSTTATDAATPLSEALVNLRLQRRHDYHMDNLDSEVPAMRRVVEQVRLASRVRVPVLLVGEPGTGKEWVARTIHQQSDLREAPLVGVDCARLPVSFVAALLFGDGRAGPVVTRGCVYLREPASLTHDLQEQLAQQLADGAWQGVSDTWLMAGSSTDPLGDLRAGRLLEDLYCRLSPLTMAVPPLRQRLADLPLLVERTLERLRWAGDDRRLTVAQDAWDLLHNYAWPGNLRELQGVLHEARRRARTERIEVGDLPAYLKPTAVRSERTLPLKTLLAQVERRLIELALAQTKHNKSRAAEMLGIWRALLLRRMNALGIADRESQNRGS